MLIVVVLSVCGCPCLVVGACVLLFVVCCVCVVVVWFGLVSVV